MTPTEEHAHLNELLAHLTDHSRVETPHGPGRLNGCYTEPSHQHPMGTVRVRLAHGVETDFAPHRVTLCPTP